MGLIALEGLQFYAFHGVYEEEALIGNRFSVDVYINTSFDHAAQEDNVFRTINYETVFLVCQAEMRKPVKLIETLAQNMIWALKHQFSTIQSVKIRISKQNPLPHAKLNNVYVEEEDSFLQQCPRCSRRFLCYGDDNCWCQNVQIHSRTREALVEQFNGCLCNNCLDFYAG